MESLINNFRSLPSREVFPGFVGRFVHTDNLTFAYWEISSGASGPEHNHVHEQTVIVQAGRLEFTIEGKSRVLDPGMIAVVPSNAKHSAKALTDCIVLDVFCPVREDYK